MSARFVAVSQTMDDMTSWWRVMYSEDGVQYERVPLMRLDYHEAEKVALFLNQYIDEREDRQ